MLHGHLMQTAAMEGSVEPAFFLPVYTPGMSLRVALSMSGQTAISLQQTLGTGRLL